MTNVLKIFVNERDNGMTGWRKFRNEELHNLYSSPHILRIIEARWMGRAIYSYVAHERSEQFIQNFNL
jgi:hypothetical protein